MDHPDPDDPTVAQMRRRHRRQRVVWAAGVLIVVLIVFGGVGYFSSASLEALTFATTPWARRLGGLLVFAGALVEVAAIVFAIRSGRLGRGFRSPLWALTRAQRRSLRRQINRNDVEPGTDLATLRLMATSLVEQIWITWIFGGLTIVLEGQLLVTPTPAQIGTGIGAASCWLAQLVVAMRQAAVADTFLADHPTVHTGVSTADATG
jgi:hypothetical protein